MAAPVVQEHTAVPGLEVARAEDPLGEEAQGEGLDHGGAEGFHEVEARLQERARLGQDFHAFGVVLGQYDPIVGMAGEMAPVGFEVLGIFT